MEGIPVIEAKAISEATEEAVFNNDPIIGISHTIGTAHIMICQVIIVIILIKNEMALHTLMIETSIIILEITETIEAKGEDSVDLEMVGVTVEIWSRDRIWTTYLKLNLPQLMLIPQWTLINLKL
ncbi:hypothetical protein X975_21777, partial [Stegodyphus mimosarum]